MRPFPASVRGRADAARVLIALALGLAAAIAWMSAWPLASLASTVADYEGRGPYAVEVREIDVPRPAAGDAFGARLFVPHPDETDGGVLEVSPVYAFGHGYLAPVEVYESTLEHLASWGITVVAPRSGGELFPSHERFAADLVAALDEVTSLAADDTWDGLPVDAGARAVGGHSMGGGAAVLAASLDPSIRTVATLNAADTRPSAITAAADVTAPMLLVAGSEDRITPVDGHQRPIFEAAAGPAQLRTIEGGGHCGVLDRADLMSIVCGGSSLEAGTQRDLAHGALAAWLRGQLMSDGTAEAAIWNLDPEGPVDVRVRGLAEG